MNIKFLNILTNGKEIKNGKYEDDYKIIKILDDCVEVYTKQNNKSVKINTIKIHEDINSIVEQISYWYDDKKVKDLLRFKEGVSDKEKQYALDNFKYGYIATYQKIIKFN